MHAGLHITSYRQTHGDYITRLQAILASYKAALTNIHSLVRDSQTVTQSSGNQLLYYSELLKDLQDGEDELIDDLATVLHLVILTTFCAKHQCTEEGLGLANDIICLLQKNLTHCHQQELDQQEVMTMNKRVWTWLDNSNYYRAYNGSYAAHIYVADKD